MNEERAHTGGNGADRIVDPVDSLRDAVAQAGVLKEYAEQYLAARIDLARVRTRKVVIAIALGLLGLIAGAVLLGVAVGMLMSGMAGGLGEALGGRVWAGNLIVGGGVLGLLGLGGWIGLRMYTKANLRTTMERYERRQHEQQLASGADAVARARGAGKAG